MTASYSQKAAERGEPGYVWRSGQDRRLQMVRQWSDLSGRVLDNGSGLGTWIRAFKEFGGDVFGLEVEIERIRESVTTGNGVIQSVGEYLPYASSSFDTIFSNEVIEHVADDQLCMAEMVRVLKPGGRLIMFCPNRWYPVEQHGIYWKGEYKFGNIPLVNYLPNVWRDQLAPHVRTYTKRNLRALYQDLPVKELHHGRIFGGYDNIVHRRPTLGKTIRKVLYTAERTPFAVLGISHFVVLEKTN